MGPTSLGTSIVVKEKKNTIDSTLTSRLTGAVSHVLFASLSSATKTFLQITSLVLKDKKCTYVLMIRCVLFVIANWVSSL